MCQFDKHQAEAARAAFECGLGAGVVMQYPRA